MKILNNFYLGLCFLFISIGSTFSQTTYTWNGGNGAWNVAANWTPTRTTPAATDILQFDDGGTYTLTAVPTQTIRRLIISNNSQVTLQAATTNTLTISGPASETNLLIEDGALLSNTATNILSITFTSNTQIGDISGTLNWRGGTLTLQTTGANVTTVSATGVVNHFLGTITAAVNRLVFADGSEYHRKGTSPTTHAIPVATYETNSTVFIEELTTTGNINGFSAKSYGNVVYNCASQGNVVVSFAMNGTATRVKGDFNIISTGAGTGSVNFKNITTAVTLNVDGLFNLSGGNVNANVGGTAGLTLNLNGGYAQSGGTFNSSTANIACTININGSFNQSGGTFTRTVGTTVTTINFNGVGDFIISGGTHTNTFFNYNIANNGNITMQNDLLLSNGRQFTVAGGGRLNLGTHVISGVTTTTFSVAANGTLGIGSQDGITTTGASGNIQTNTRTYTAGAHYIYTGTNGQVTGNGQPAAATGFIMLDMLNDTDQLTFTNPTLSGNGVNLRIRSGRVANVLSFTNATASTLTYEGIAAQTSTDNEFPATNGPRRLTINNPNGVTLHASRILPANGILTLTDGILNTSTSELLTLQNTAIASVVGGSNTSYINGPFERQLASLSAGSYVFPVGKTQPGLFTINLQGATSATQFIQVEHFETAPGGTAGANFNSIENRYWSVQRNAGIGNLNNVTVTINANGINADSRVGYSSTLTGNYDNIGGAVSVNQVTSVLSGQGIGFFTIGESSTLSGTVTSFNNLTEIANVLRTNIVTGDVIFELPTTYSGEPGYPVVFNEFATSGPLYNVTIRPAAGSTNFLTAGDPGSVNSLIDLDGIDRLTIDGRAGGAGGIVWTFRNTRTAATVGATFRLINDATNNTLTYLNVEGQSLANQGNIFFSTSASGVLGNSDNSITNCHIRNRSDNSNTPAKGIFSLGTASIQNANNIISSNQIYNFFNGTTSGAGVWLGLNNVAWTITDNHFYQTASRNGTGASVSRYGIYIVNGNALSDNFTITGNYIGGSEINAGGSAWTITGNVNHNFAGIHISTLTGATNNVVENNVIRNISLNHGTLANSVVFAGIRSLNAANLIRNNTIADITITEALTSGANFAHGIYIDAGNASIESNIVNNIATGSVGGSIGLTGISQLSISTTAPGTIITGNTVSNLSSIYNGTIATAQVRGIVTAATGTNTITGNTIFNLSSNSTMTGVGTAASVVGLAKLSNTAAVQTISNNTIHSLTNGAPTQNVSLVGMFFNGSTTLANNTISNNIVHSLGLSTSNALATITGMQFNTGAFSAVNNMIRLGIDGAGNDIIGNYTIRGINHVPTTINSAYYYNTVYIGGTGVSTGTNNTYAFFRTAASGNIFIKNNIFYNARSNNTGTGAHFAIGLASMTGILGVNVDFNYYHAGGIGGNIGQDVSNTRSTLADWQGILANLDANSITGSLAFVDATGNAADVDLHIDVAFGTQIESAGTTVGVGTWGDFDGDIRFGEAGYTGSGTAPDIGADENNFTPIDLTPPSISYTPIATQISFAAPSLNATITDASGVNTTSGTRPRLYFKRTTDANTFVDNTSTSNGWKWVEATNTTSPFNFNINYSLLNGGNANALDEIQYFVVAQDEGPSVPINPNVAINSGDFNTIPNSVALTAGAFPITGTINSYLINVLSGTVTIGTSGIYTSLTNDGGLFQAINSGALSADLIAEIVSDLTAETGTHALNQWTEVGAGNYTLTIRPNDGTTRTIQNTGTTNIALFRLDGADRVIIDGRDPANIGLGGRHLIFTNSTASTGAATFQFINEATNNIIRYSTLRGSTTSTTLGIVAFGTSAAGSIGNSNNTIDNCNIHENASALPRNGIYSVGTALRINSNNTISNNNIYNFFNAGGGSHGIFLGLNTSGWTIENNRFYQEATRTTTTASTFHYVININNTANANTIIRNNYIGGNAADGSGVMTYTAAVANQFAPIYLNTNATVGTPTIVENNTITNIAFTTTSGATSAIGPFTAIYQLAGASRIIGNTIGASTGTNAIAVTVNTNANGVVNAIRYDGTSTVKIENNIIGGITVTGTGTNNGTNFYAVNIVLGNVAIKNNLIGSASTANSIQISGTATTNASILGAINLAATAAYLDSVISNSIYNLTNFNTGSATRIFGVSATSGAQYIIEENTIRNLSLTASTQNGLITNSAVLGISMVTANTQPLTLSRNTIHSLSNGGSGASAFTTGIFYNGGSNVANVLEKNFIHSLSPSSGATSSVVGMLLAGGTTTNVRNNMVRLGIAANGTSIAQSHNIYGIQQTANTLHNISYNSIYIGGTGVVGNINTFAYARTAGTAVLNIRNNIFVNSRDNGTGTGSHYAIGLINSLANVTCNYNLYHANGNGGAVGLAIATPHANITSWQSSTGFDLNSLYGAPGFIDAVGNAAAVDLHIDPAIPTQIESAGISISGISDDFDGDIRFGETGYVGTGTAVDIGADEGDFTPVDLTPPFISYTPIPNQTDLTGPSLSAIITDASGVEITTGTAPRIYYKRSTDANTFIDNTNATNGWKFVESTTGSSPFDFTINYALLFGGSVNGQETIEYFVVAQDMATVPNVGINSGDFNAAPSSVALTSSAFPLTGTINSYLINVLSGLVTVGTTGMYPSLTNDGGLFQAINSGALSANLIAEIISDLTAELGTHALNEWTEIGAGTYTLTIRPDGNTIRVISGNYVGASAALAGLFRFDGADRVIVDGRDPNDLAAGGRHLLFRNISNTNSNFNSTFNLINDATNNTFRYAIIEGATTSVNNGAFRISANTPATGSGNNNNSVEHCFIRNRTDVASTLSNGVYAIGTSTSILNSNITFANNHIYDYFLNGTINSGIYVAANNTSWTVTDNHFYQTSPRNGTTASNRYGIFIGSTVAGSDNYTISGNFIGGSAANANGTWTNTGAADQGFTGIYFQANASASNSVIENNVIRNIAWQYAYTSTTVAPNKSVFVGIRNVSGNNLIKGNIIGAPTGTASISLTYTGPNSTSLAYISTAYGIFMNGGNVTVEDNSIGSINTSATAATLGIAVTGVHAAAGIPTITGNLIGSETTPNSIFSTIAVTANNGHAFRGIFIPGTAGVVANNTIGNINSNYSGTNANAQVSGITMTTGGNKTITGNKIFKLNSNSGSTGSVGTSSVLGIFMNGTTASTIHTVSNNEIHSLSNGNTGANAINVAGIVYSGNTTAGSEISKNFIHSLGLNGTGTGAAITGIIANAGAATYHNNMVRLGLDSLGNDITTGYIIRGIHSIPNTANINFYFNTVYMGGQNVGGANNTFAFQRTAGTAAMNIRNNIFVNRRSNNAGTGLHHSIGLNATTGVTSNNNIFHANGTGGRTGLINATSYSLLNDWQVASGFDANSFYENITFLNADAGADLVDLHVNNTIPTQAESGGVDVGIYDDIDGDIRFGGVGYAGTGSAPDIGADEDNFGSLDVTPPVITYTPIGTQISFTEPAFSANVTDNGTVETTPGFAPRFYFKKSTDANTFAGNTSGDNGWKFVESSTGSSPFGFSIDYNLLFGGGVSAGDVIEYFVVAQDVAGNFAANSATFNTAPSDVDLLAANFPVSGTINSYLINVLAGVVTVGTSGTYPSLTNSGGLFEAINNAALSGNVIAEIISDLTAESGTHALNEWTEIGAGNYTLTIRPNNNTDRNISGTYVGANAAVAGLFRFDGADRVIIDGRDPNNIAANGRHLRFTNNNVANSNFNASFLYINDATTHVLRNSIIEGASASATNGVIRIATAGTGNGNDNITIENNQIKNAAGLPVNGIFALGTSGNENDNISILNNEIFDIWSPTLTSSGILVSTFNSDWTISGNSIFQTANRAGTGATIIRYGIQVNNAGENYNISNNHIGGTQVNSGGSDMTTSGTVNQAFYGIFISPNPASDNNVVTGNTIRRINFSRGTTANAIGFAGINSVGAATTISNNTIDLISVTENLTSGANAIHGIYITSGNATLSGNSISNMQTLSTAGATSLIGISQIAGNASISNNTINNLTLAYNGTTSTYQLIGINLAAGLINVIGNTIHTLNNSSTSIGTGLTASTIGISQGSSTTGQVISQNTIYGLQSNAASANTQVLGILFRNAGGTNEVSRNFVHSLNNTSTGASASMIGIMALTGVATYHNNMIRLGIDVNGTNVSNGLSVIGISQQSTTANNQFYYNSIYIGGINVIGANNTFAFARQAGTNAIDVRNNIFSNARSNGVGSGSHYAIGFINSIAGIVSNHNYFNVQGIGGNVGLALAVQHNNLASWQSTTFDANSLEGALTFINADGDAASVDLHLDPLLPNQLESQGVNIAGLTIDFDGDLRFGDAGYTGAGTAPDIGADENDFLFADLTPPVIIYTPIANQSSLTEPSLSATITDNVGINTTPGLRPRLYFKRSTDNNTFAGNTSADNGWKFVESLSASTPFDFTLNYNLLFGGPPTGIVNIQYFVVAQDFQPNVAVNQAVFNTAPSSVALTAAHFPVSGSINNYNILVLNGVATVGTNPTDIFPSLTNNGGAFEAINGGVLSGNLILEITSDLITESGTHALNEWAESGVGNYTLTIRPSDNTDRIISGTYAGANTSTAGLIRFNGADRVIIDGRDPSNLAGNGRHLLFRNESTAASNFNGTISYINDAVDHVLRYAIIESGTAGTVNGAIRINSISGSGSGNDNIEIDNCHIRNLTSISGQPSHGIYATGLFNRVNDNITMSNNEFYNYHLASTAAHAAIYLGSYNTDCSITGNSIYQTVVHTTASHKFGIIIDAATGAASNMIVSNNFIGGNAPGATGTWQVNASGQDYRFTGISMSMGITTGNVVEDNVIRNFNITTGTAFQTQGSLFTGIFGSNGEYLIRNNTIGSLSQAGSITLVCSAGQFTNFQGIFHSGNAAINVQDNQIGGVNISNTISSANIVNMYGIRVGSSTISQNITVTGNTIGDATAPLINSTGNTFNAANGATIAGIHVANARPTTVSNNLVNNIQYAANGTSSSTTNAFSVIGIERVSAAAANNVIENNVVHSLSTSSPYAQTGAVAALIGISHRSTSAGQTLKGNTVYGLNHTNASAAATVTGIYYSGPTAGTNLVDANFVHSLNGSSSSASLQLNGIVLGGGLTTVTNNMVRLGIDAAGNSITASRIIQGILKETANNHNIWHNSVYIGGSGVATVASNTFAFRRTVTGTDNVRNNIFANARSNATTGGNHFAFAINAITTYTGGFNIFHTPGNGGTIGSVNGGTTPLNFLAVLSQGIELSSGVGNPNFINPLGNASAVDLHLQASNPAEGSGVLIASVIEDFDGDIRADFTPADIGADAANFSPITPATDIFPPQITFTPIVGGAVCSPIPTTLLNATIFDGGTGVPTTGANRPRAYFRRSAPAISAWASVPGTLVSGNQFNGDWQFVLDYSLLSITPTGGETYQYYIVAQDLATNPVNPNLGLSHFDANVAFTNNNVNSPITHPVAPASFSFTNPLSGVVTVGSGGDYPSFNLNPGGLFHAINTSGLSGNLEVHVISNINESANWTPLSAPQEFCGSDYTVTIRPNPAAPATVYTIETNTSAANAMFSFLGARRIIIDGRYDNAGRFLRLRHNRTTAIFASTVEYNNGANNNVIRNCIIEGANTNFSNNTTGSVGVVRVGGSMGFASGNLNNITIQDNLIRNLSNVSPTLSNVPNLLVYLGGASSNANINNITITGNDFTNFQGSAIRADNGTTFTNSIGNNISITNNNIYQELTIPTYQYPIVLDALGNTFGHVISGNKIGGNTSPNPDIAGTWINNKIDGEIQAIYANVGNAPTQAEALSIQGNKIQNINISGTGWTNFVGIRIERGRVRIGDEVGNVIGSEDNSVDNIISNGSGGSFLSEDAAVMGIWTQSAEEVVIENNIISGLSTGLGTFCFFDGIAHGSNLFFNGIQYSTPGGKSTIRNNVIANNRSSSNLQSSTVSNEGMISLFLHTNSMENLVEGNLIQNNGLNAIVNNNVRNHGAMLGILGQLQNHGGIFRKNTIAALANSNAGQASPNTAPEVNGLVLNHGNWEVSNNMISLRNGTTGTHIDFRNTFVIGIRDHLRNLAGQGANYLYNSIYIYGVNGGSGAGNPSYNYLRIPNNAGNVAGAPTVLRNNILINERSGIGSHRAIGNINTGSPATGWNTAASDFNFVATATASTATRWGTTDYTFANWRTITGGDANSIYVPTAASTIANVQLLPTELFESDFLFGNLRISGANTDASDFIDNNATPLLAVIDDIDGDLRDPFTPDIGADEFNVCSSPQFTLQPVDQLNICNNGNVVFNATVFGQAPINLQWQESTDGGSTWNDLSNAGIYSGVNTNTLTLTGVTSSLNNNQYRLLADNVCGSNTSDEVELTITPLPQITAYSPLTFINSICSGNTSFSVTATGVGLTYQWQESVDGGSNWNDVSNVAPYSGATTSMLQFSNIPPPNLNGNKYRLIITDACGEVLTSDEGTLIIGVAFVDAQPIVEQTVCSGSVVNIDVDASGLGLTFQWQFSSDNGSTWNNATTPTYSGSNTDNLSFTASSALNGYLYRVIINSSVCPGATTSDASLLNVEFPGQWLGAGTDWDTPSNWGCGIVPTTTTDVLIPTNPIFGDVFPVVSSASLSVARDLSIQPGASVTVQSASNLSLHGNFTNNGFNGMGTGAVRFVGNSLQVIDGTAQTEFGAIDLNNSTTIQPALELNQHISVLGAISMLQGRLHLNGSDIDLLGTGSIVNESNANRIYGDLGEIKTVLNMAANTTYNDIFGMGVSIITSATAPGLTVIERGHFQHSHMGSYQSIQRYFDINPVVNASLDATLRINYFDDELDVTFGPPPVKANLLPWRSTDNGATWEGQFFPSNLTNDIVNNWVQLTSIPAFSRWTLSDWVNNPLPVQLLSFTATADYSNQQVDLQWLTASEINNAFFTVERSANAQSFQPVLSRPGAGNSNTVITYNDVDPNPLMGISYYRLKQTDFDGSTTYSDVVPVNFQQQVQASANVYAAEAGNIYLQYFGLKRGRLDVNIYDAGGRLIGNYQFNAAQGSNQFLISDLDLATGVYIIRINDGVNVFSNKLMLKTR